MFLIFTDVKAPEKPTYVRTRTFSDSVILSWQPPLGDVTVKGYKVGYGEGVPDLHWRYVAPSKRNVTITELSKFYKINKGTTGIRNTIRESLLSITFLFTVK